VLGRPDRGHVEVPELVGVPDAEEPGPAPILARGAVLDQLALAHHPEHALAVHAPARVPIKEINQKSSTWPGAGQLTLTLGIAPPAA
jgi:hypothetical protein